MSTDDYNRGKQDGQYLQSLTNPAPAPVAPPIVVTQTHTKVKRVLDTAMIQEVVLVTKRLKEAEANRDEWRVYAKQLECAIDGFTAMRNALAAEIEHCTAPHPLRETSEQQKLYDAAYIAEAKKNGLPESQWSDKVLARRDQK
jgi:hypothetical protein